MGRAPCGWAHAPFATARRMSTPGCAAAAVRDGTGDGVPDPAATSGSGTGRGLHPAGRRRGPALDPGAARPARGPTSVCQRSAREAPRPGKGTTSPGTRSAPPPGRARRRGFTMKAGAPMPPTTPTARKVADSEGRQHDPASSRGPSRRNHADREPSCERCSHHVAARLEERIRRVVAAAPPLTREQRDRLAVLLRATPTGRDVACDRPIRAGPGMQRGRSTTPTLHRQKKEMRAMKHASERKGQ